MQGGDDLHIHPAVRQGVRRLFTIKNEFLEPTHFIEVSINESVVPRRFFELIRIVTKGSCPSRRPHQLLTHRSHGPRIGKPRLVKFKAALLTHNSRLTGHRSCHAHRELHCSAGLVSEQPAEC